MNIYITGDKHGNLNDIRSFVRRTRTSKDETLLIIAGDAGFNYKVYKDEDGLYKDDGSGLMQGIISNMPLTIAVIQGNHEAPAWFCEGFKEVDFAGDRAYWNSEYPNIYYLENGHVYNFNGQEYLVMGGAYTIDKPCRSVPTKNHRGHYGYWFPEEQMTDDEFVRAWSEMEKRNYRIHGVLTHTCPYEKRPQDLFLKVPKGFAIDNRMEHKFSKFMQKLTYDVWYFGHFHGDFNIDSKHKLVYHAIKKMK